MSDDRPVEPIARDLLADGSAALTLRLDAFAGGLAHRLEGFGVARRSEDSPLLQAITARWTLPDRLDGGIELFDLDAFDAWAADWSIRAGYDDVVGDAESAGFVIPIDPDLRPAGIDARSARREGRAERAFRPVVAPRRAETRAAARAEARAPARAEAHAPATADAFAPARVEARTRAERRAADVAASRASALEDAAGPLADAPLVAPAAARVETAERAATARAPIGPSARAGAARERWRAVDGERLSAYPAAMGRAGALDASLLRFPEARARIGGERPAVIAAPAGFDLTPDTAGLAPAARGAERRVQALVDRLVPAAPSAVAGWLVPVAAADADGRPLPAASARPGRWQSIGLGPAFAVPAATPVDAPAIGIGARLAAAADEVVARVDGAPAPAGEARTYELEPAGVLVEPGAERTPVEARVESSPRRGREKSPTAAEARAAAPVVVTPAATPTRATPGERSVATPAANAVTRRTADAATPTTAAPGVTPSAAQPRSIAAVTTPVGETATAARAARPTAAGDASDARGPRPSAARATTTRGGLARGLAERFAATGEGSEPRLAARALLLDALLGQSTRLPTPAAATAEGLVDARPAPIGATERPLPAGPEFMAGRSAAAFLLGAVGPSIGRFADRLAVGVGGEPGATAAWPVAPTGELVAIGPDGAPVEQRGAGAAAAVSAPSGRAVAPAATSARASVATPAIGAPATARAERGAAEVFADRVAASAATREAGRADAAARLASPAEPAAAPVDAAGTPATSSARPAAARTSVIDALQAALAAGPAAAGEVGRAASALAGRVGARLEALVGGGEAARPMSGVVERLAAVLGAGPRPALLDAVRRFEAAEDAAEGARAWTRISALAELGPSAPELVQPVLEAAAAAREAARSAPATRTPTARPALGRPAASAAETAAERQAAIELLVRRMGRRAAAQGATADAGPRWARWAEVLAPLVGGSTRPGATPAAATAALAGWVLDPSGRSWIRPATRGAAPGATAAPQSAAERPVIGAARGSIGDGGARVEALAARIAAAVEPMAAAPVAAEQPGSIAAPGVLGARNAGGPAFSFAGEAATTLVQGEATSAATGTASRAARPGRAAAPAGSPAETAALVAMAREVARGLGRPGAVGVSSERLAATVTDRPAALRLRRSEQAARASIAAAAGPAVTRIAGASPDAPFVAGAPGARVDVDGPASARRPAADRRAPEAAVARRFASLMDMAALVESDALTASEARMPARLAGWWRAAAAPAAEGTESDVAFADAALARVVVAPFGAPGGERFERADGGVRTSRASQSATANAALVAFERARASARGGARAAAVGRVDTPADLGELFAPPTPAAAEPLRGSLFGDRGPQAVTAPGRPRVLVETGRAAGDQPLRSATGETPGRSAEKNEESRHRLAEQMEGDLSPEEIEEIAEEVIGILRREVEFDMARLGEDEWD
ncbi:MAG: hypothetical protein R3F65_12035 [bacterium]